MRKWMRDRMKRRNKPGAKAQGEQPDQNQNEQAPLQPTFLDREGGGWESNAPDGPKEINESEREPQYEAQPEHDPMDAETPGEPQEPAAPQKRGAAGNRGGRSRRRGRGGRSGRTQQQQAAASQASGAPVLPIEPGSATGEAGEVDEVPPERVGVEPAPQAKAEGKKGKAPRGAVVLAIGLPGSGKSSWFRRHNIIPLSSDLVRGLLFDSPTEQRHQDLVFSTLRYMLRMRLVSGRPMNFIDATNLSPKERHSWIKMAKDNGYEAHAVFFDVPAEVCMERNRKRSRNVPDEIMIRMSQKLRPPKFEEGFAKITIVRLKKSDKKEQLHEPFADPEE